MTGTDQNENTNEEKHDLSSSLYHKEDVRKRRVPPDYRPTGGARKGPARDLSHTAMLSNIRVLAVVLAFMLVLLLAALWVVRTGMNWRSRPSVNRQAAGTTQENTTLAEAASGTEQHAGTGAEEESLFKGTPLDTSAIRKAVFLSKQGNQLADGGDLRGAVERYREALAVWPNHVQTWIDLGQTYLKLGRFEQAQIALEKAAEQDPANVAVLNDLGVAHMHRGDLTHAEQYFNAAVEISADFPEPYYNLALCQLSKRSNDLARAYLDLFLRKSPGDARALKELAYLDALSGNYEGARVKLDQAMQKNPDWAALYFDAAAAAALQGHVDATFLYLEKALRKTTPRITYQVYQQPAFNSMRNTELGKEFEKLLAGEARNQLNETDSTQAEPQQEENVSSLSGSPEIPNAEADADATKQEP